MRWNGHATEYGDVLTRHADRRAHKTPRRPVQRGFPKLARDSFQGPPVRPREGQCHEESEEAVRRIEAVKDYESRLEHQCVFAVRLLLHDDDDDNMNIQA